MNDSMRPSGKFRSGQSGNPAGKPRGSRHSATILAEKLMKDDEREIVAAVVAAAKSGDMVAARLVLDRIAPVRKGRAINFPIPAGNDAASIAKGFASIMAGIGSGELTPEEALSVSSLLDAWRKSLETLDLEQRVAALETAAKNGEKS